MTFKKILITGFEESEIAPKFWKRIDTVLEQKVFHIWAHPIDLVNDTEKIMANLERICEYASQKRGNKILKIQTMGEIASESDL